MSLGTRVRAQRLARGLTQERLAHAAGITKNHVQLLEAGRGSPRDPTTSSNPHMSKLFGLADALEVPPSALIFGAN